MLFSLHTEFHYIESILSNYSFQLEKQDMQSSMQNLDHIPLSLTEICERASGLHDIPEQSEFCSSTSKYANGPCSSTKLPHNNNTNSNNISSNANNINNINSINSISNNTNRTRKYSAPNMGRDIGLGGGCSSGSSSSSSSQSGCGGGGVKHGNKGCCCDSMKGELEDMKDHLDRLESTMKEELNLIVGLLRGRQKPQQLSELSVNFTEPRTHSRFATDDDDVFDTNMNSKNDTKV